MHQKHLKRNLKFELFSIGLDTYWPQFKGFKPRLEKFVRLVECKLARPDVEVVNHGLIDNSKSALPVGCEERHGFQYWSALLQFATNGNNIRNFWN